MKLGAQMSASGGAWKAFARADEAGCETVMIYTKSNRMWKSKPISEKDIAKFHETAASYAGKVDPLVVHAAYLINVASNKPEVLEKSAVALRDEIERAEQLGIENLVFHPGSHMGEGEAVGLAKIVTALKQVIADTPGYNVRVCLETMAGQGTNLGHKFEHLGYLLKEIDNPGRVGVCFDTCHVFTAGYDIRTPEAYAETMAQFDEIVGLEQIHCFHLNDSKHDLGSRKDRHQHIGRGFLGEQAFANFVNDPRWQDHPAHLETPKTDKDADDEIEMDTVNLKTLRGLIRSTD